VTNNGIEVEVRVVLINEMNLLLLDCGVEDKNQHFAIPVEPEWGLGDPYYCRDGLRPILSHALDSDEYTNRRRKIFLKERGILTPSGFGSHGFNVILQSLPEPPQGLALDATMHYDPDKPYYSMNTLMCIDHKIQGFRHRYDSQDILAWLKFGELVLVVLWFNQQRLLIDVLPISGKDSTLSNELLSRKRLLERITSGDTSHADRSVLGLPDGRILHARLIKQHRDGSVQNYGLKISIEQSHAAEKVKANPWISEKIRAFYLAVGASCCCYPAT
jgi:hypothetical protein